jgi:hypothetical protein
METNLNYWGLLSMATGVLVCFGPALFVWIKAEMDEKKSNPKK